VLRIALCTGTPISVVEQVLYRLAGLWPGQEQLPGAGEVVCHRSRPGALRMVPRWHREWRRGSRVVAVTVNKRAWDAMRSGGRNVAITPLGAGVGNSEKITRAVKGATAAVIAAPAIAGGVGMAEAASATTTNPPSWWRARSTGSSKSSRKPSATSSLNFWHEDVGHRQRPASPIRRWPCVQLAFDQPGILERTYHGPLGAATGAEWLHARITDLLAHGWDLAQATGQPAELPEDLAEQALPFVQIQLSRQSRTGRFGPAQPVAEDAPAIDQLVAFLGRPLSPGW